jgi:hypothetical protein
LGVAETAVEDAIAAIRDAADAEARPSSDATDDEKAAARDARQSAFAAALADELGLDEATVADALSDLRAEREANREAMADAHEGDGSGHARGDRADHEGGAQESTDD